jgi:hypothetical protein
MTATIRSLMLAAAACLAFAAHAADDKAADAKAPTAQQTKMATCNKEAGDKKGDERKAFMKSCLSAKPETQQAKMKRCNAEAKGKAGDERKAFMSDCLKATPKAA